MHLRNPFEKQFNIILNYTNVILTETRVNKFETNRQSKNRYSTCVKQISTDQIANILSKIIECECIDFCE